MSTLKPKPHTAITPGARLTGAFLLGGALLWAAPALAEPTEAEMRAAVEAQFENANAEMRSTAERCSNREFNRGQGDPVLAMQCIQYAMTGGMTQGGQGVRAPQFKLSRFEKIGCEKAQGKVGYLCDYVAGFGSDMRNMPPSLQRMTNDGSLSQGRFVKRGDRWLRLPE